MYLVKVAAYRMFTDGSDVSRGRTCYSGALYGFLKQSEDGINSLERKVENLKHMKLEVMQPKIKNKSERE